MDNHKVLSSEMDHLEAKFTYSVEWVKPFLFF